MDHADKISALREQSDEDVLAASTKNPSCFVVLVERYQEPFLRKARRIVKGEEEAQDVVQEAFTKIYMNAHKYEKMEGASFKSWGYKIVVNTAITHYQKMKKNSKNTVVLEHDFYHELPDGQDREAKSELSDYVASVISRMPEGMARILSLHFLEGWQHKEIAEAEGVSEGAVKTRVHRAKKVFREIESRLNL